MRVDPIVPIGASLPDPTNAQRIPWGEQNRPRERRTATLKMMVLSVSGQSMGRVVQYHMRPFLFRTRRCSVSVVVVTVQLNGSKQSRRRRRVCFRWWVPLRPGEIIYRVPIAWRSVDFGSTVWHMAAVASRGAGIALVGKTRIDFRHCHWSDSHYDGPARHLRLQERNVSVVVNVVVGQSVQVTSAPDRRGPGRCKGLGQGRESLHRLLHQGTVQENGTVGIELPQRMLLPWPYVFSRSSIGSSMLLVLLLAAVANRASRERFVHLPTSELCCCCHCRATRTVNAVRQE
jgi:hypothetical protein